MKASQLKTILKEKKLILPVKVVLFDKNKSRTQFVSGQRVTVPHLDVGVLIAANEPDSEDKTAIHVKFGAALVTYQLSAFEKVEVSELTPEEKANLGRFPPWLEHLKFLRGDS